MKVSVVVPAFNQAEYLREALASALGQTHTDLEVIVVDDGSTDGTRSVCESIADPRLRYIHQPNDRTMGLGARNRAILESAGEWIALLDQDDRWLPTKIERQLALAATHPAAGAVFTLVNFIDGAGRVTRQQADDVPEGEVYHALMAHNRYYSCSGMFRRSLLSVAGLPGESVGLGDWHLWLALARHAPVLVVRDHLADYREHPQGYTFAAQKGLDRIAFDVGRTLHAQRHRWHPGCTVCRQTWRRGMRDVAKLYLRHARAVLARGSTVGVGQAVLAAVETAPGWVLRPWIVVREGWGLLRSAARGLFARRNPGSG
jgi:glycosyltransferase involved in cell wall biosynthesis